MNPDLFTPWQRRMLANALVAFAVLFLAALAVGGVGLVFYFLLRLKAILIPVAIGALLAYLLMPPVDWLQEKRGWSRTNAVFTVFGLGALAIAGVTALVLPAIIHELSEFAHKVPDYFQRSVACLLGAIERVQSWDVPPSWQSSIDTINDQLKKSAPDVVKLLTQGALGLLSSAFDVLGAVIGFIIIPVYVFYFLRDQDFFATNWKLYVPVAHTSVRHDVIMLLQEINETVKAFFRGQCIVAACVGALSALGFFIVGVDFALLLGVWVGIFDLVPFFGIIAGAVPATLIAFAQHGGWQYPLATIAVCIIVHLLENTIIAPKIVGKKTGLHPLAVVLSILIWGKLLGFIGILLAVPLTSTLKVLFRHYLWQKLPAKA